MRKRALHFALEQDIYTCYGKRACRLVTGKGHVDLSLEKCIYIYIHLSWKRGIYTCNGKRTLHVSCGKGIILVIQNEPMYFAWERCQLLVIWKWTRLSSWKNVPRDSHGKVSTACHRKIVRVLVMGKRDPAFDMGK